MRLIRPSAMSPRERRRTIGVALGMLGCGATAAILAALASGAGSGPIALLAVAAALGLGVGTAWLVRILRPNRARKLGGAVADRLAPAFDDSYTLVVAPRLPLRDAGRLDGVLVGPGGVRIVTARDWEGRYRVRGKTWEFDAGRRGWISCRTNPSYEAVALAEGFARWCAELGLGDPPVRGVAAFPMSRSRLVLEEPADEILTADNAPWWANAIGRVRRLDPESSARLITAILDASEAASTAPRRGTVAPPA